MALNTLNQPFNYNIEANVFRPTKYESQRKWSNQNRSAYQAFYTTSKPQRRVSEPYFRSDLRSNLKTCDRSANSSDKVKSQLSKVRFEEKTEMLDFTKPTSFNYKNDGFVQTESVSGILHCRMDPDKKVECAFCKRNNSADVNHLLKDQEGGVVCPVLAAFTCKMCAATGRNAHTHKYCPQNPFTKGDPVAAGMPPGRPLTREDRQWLKYFHARAIMNMYFDKAEDNNKVRD